MFLFIYLFICQLSPQHWHCHGLDFKICGVVVVLCSKKKTILMWAFTISTYKIWATCHVLVKEYANLPLWHIYKCPSDA